jgi:UDP-N-acetylmuramate dehydrogenase
MGWREKVKEICPKALLDEPMSAHTTFRIGGPADLYAELATMDELSRVWAALEASKTPSFILGWGSNLLVQDGGVRGAVLRLRGDFEKVEFPGGRLVRAGAGVRVPQLVTQCAERGLAGSEPLVGVPGTVGGALAMNAGTRDGEIGPLVREVSVLDPGTGKEKKIPASELAFSYRASNLQGRVILFGLLELNVGEKGDILKRVQANQQRRQQTQPIHTYNVGSIFKNPPGQFVAKLIEEAGLKGATQGGARVSPMHANFIENHSRASARDVLDLVARIQAEIKARSGVSLELEMKVVGEPA